MSTASRIFKNSFVITIIAMFLYMALAFSVDIQKFSASILEFNYLTIPVILLPMTVHIFLLGFRFHRLILQLNVNSSIKESLLIYLAGLSFGITPGGVGQMIKSHYIKKKFGTPISKTAPVVLIEKWTELNSVILILLIFSLFVFIPEAEIIAIIGIIISLLFLGIMKNSLIFEFFKKAFRRIKPLQKYYEIIENSQNTFKILMKPKIIVEGLILTIPAKMLEAIAVYWAFQELGLTLDFITSTQIFFSSLVSGIISFIPGGFIVTEGTMIALLTKYVGNLTVAAAAVIFVRLITIWYATFLGFVTTKFVNK